MATRAQYGRDISCSLPHVYCRFCGSAIWLSRTFTAKMASKQNEETSVQELGSRMFLARCRSCHEEAFYTLSQILDFPDEGPGKGD
jgi:thymidine kinase